MKRMPSTVSRLWIEDRLLHDLEVVGVGAAGPRPAGGAMIG